MSIDEAIARIREAAEKHRNNIVPKERYHNMPWIDKNNEVSMKCAEEHEQLAEWLELLKWYEQGMEDIPCESGVLPKDVYWAGYNRALDDIVTIIKERVGMDWEWDFCFIEQIAERLKAGGMNEYNI